MLTRKQFQLIRVASGLSFDEIVQKTGIPATSLMVLFGATEKEAKDPNKLIAQSTFEKVMSVLGVNTEMDALRAGVVVVWQYPLKAKLQGTWESAVAELRKSIFSDNIEIAEITGKGSLFSRKSKMLLLRDVETDVRIVITDTTKKLLGSVEGIFGVSSRSTETQNKMDFEFTTQIIKNGVYRLNQFDAVLGGKSFKYSWTDVQAAAKEFNFNPDDLINLMVDKIHTVGKVASITSVLEVIPTPPSRKIVVAYG